MPEAILLGTENQAKQERLAWLLDGSNVNLVTPAQASLAVPVVEEDGPSHKANATAKAISWSEAYGGIAITSDGGLVVPALGDWWDSLRTRRFFERDDLGRAYELLSRMAYLDGKKRSAYWVEAVALADRGCLLHTLTAQSSEGVIARKVDKRLIKDGFWVGAVWHFPQFGKLYAELKETELHQVGDHWSALKWQTKQLLRQHPPAWL